jgi:hypothetical protein
MITPCDLFHGSVVYNSIYIVRAARRVALAYVAIPKRGMQRGYKARIFFREVFSHDI